MHLWLTLCRVSFESNFFYTRRRDVRAAFVTYAKDLDYFGTFLTHFAIAGLLGLKSMRSSCETTREGMVVSSSFGGRFVV